MIGGVSVLQVGTGVRLKIPLQRRRKKNEEQPKSADQCESRIKIHCKVTYPCLPVSLLLIVMR